MKNNFMKTTLLVILLIPQIGLCKRTGPEESVSVKPAARQADLLSRCIDGVIKSGRPMTVALAACGRVFSQKNQESNHKAHTERQTYVPTDNESATTTF